MPALSQPEEGADSPTRVFSPRIRRALRFATKTHEVYQKQKRKGKDVPYITHPLTVALILARAGAGEDVVMAGILHDTIEDSTAEKKVTPAMLAERFGERVAQLVESVSETDKQLPWEQRKRAAEAHIEQFSHDSLLLKSADVISNMSELFDDYARNGEAAFSPFHAPKEKVLENARRVVAALLRRWPENPLRSDLREIAETLQLRHWLA